MIQTHVRIFYPADPVGIVPGGVDTFLRGLIMCAPPELRFSLVGMTTDPVARPPGRWTDCALGDRSFAMHPVCVVTDAGTRGPLPLSVRFMAGVNRDRYALSEGFDVFDFHRVEPVLMWGQDQRAKNLFFHQDPAFVRLSASDNLWRHLPAAYESLERAAMRQVRSAWCVRDSGVQRLRERYPELAERIAFVPTWVDSTLFHPVGAERRAALRAGFAAAHGLDPQAFWLVSVGRLDTQKDPLLMAEAFVRLRAAGHAVQWLVIGDGVLREPVQAVLARAGQGEGARFLGLRAPHEIADVLRAADGYALSSAYEGMPMALLEALGSGLPVVSTDVGEVRRVVRDGVNGRLVPHGEPEALAAALGELMDARARWSGAPAVDAIQDYQPGRVLAPVYENHLRLGHPLARLRTVVHGRRLPAVGRRQGVVVGVPVDVLRVDAALHRLLDWAVQRDSRYVCFVNVHSAVQATVDERHRVVLGGADMLAPDGAPIAWTLRAKGYAEQPRVDGPGTMWELLGHAERLGVAVGLYGATDATLDRLVQEIHARFPQLRLGYRHSPPFRELTPQEDQAVCRAIAESGIGLLFVGLGCPKQEFWMADHVGRLPCVMLGVGAAFEFHAGLATRAPRWMRESGLEWLHRLATHPGRLWRRYAYTNALFLAKTAGELLRAIAAWLRASPSAPER